MARKAYRALESFSPASDDYPRVIAAGDMVFDDDPVFTKATRHLFQAVDEFIEQTTKAPGEKRSVRLPSGVTQEEAVKHRTGHAHQVHDQGEPMPHSLPPEHEDSPASTFATVQPGAGVVADDVPVKNPSHNVPVTAADATKQGLGKEEAEEEPEPGPGEVGYVDPEATKGITSSNRPGKAAKK